MVKRNSRTSPSAVRLLYLGLVRTTTPMLGNSTMPMVRLT
jgi:hypothetical protein